MLPSLPVDPEGVEGAARERRPLLRRRVRPGRAGRAGAQPLLPRRAPHHVDRFVVDLTAMRRRLVDRSRRERPTDVPSAPSDAAPRTDLARRTASTGRGSSSCRQRPARVRPQHERPLFKNNPKLRQAVNFAVDRSGCSRARPALAERPPTSTCLAIPGYRDERIYPLKRPNLKKARSLLPRPHADGERPSSTRLDIPSASRRRSSRRT